MKITDEARDEFKKLFKEKNAKNIRIFFDGFGWGTPRIGLALDEPEADDIIVTINEIQVAIDPMIEPNIEDLILDRSGNGKGISMIGNTGRCC
jgi:HesB-like selenoprotein